MKALFLFGVLAWCGASFAQAPTVNQIIVLDNENLAEGNVTLVGGEYIIRSRGSEFTLPRNRVLAIVNSRQEAFTVVAERANRRDADERLRLAKWCLAQHMPEQALVEAEAAARMRPGFQAAEQMVRAIHATKATLPKVDPAITQAKAETPPLPKVEKTVDVPSVEYNSESFPLYASRVNAILMNVCASCHAQESSGKFRIYRTSGRAGVGKNMMAALAQINPKDPLSSPLLSKAIAPHGTATEAPLKSRSHPAYQTLETWVRFARAAEGTSEPEPLPAPATTASTSGEPQKLPMLDEPKLGSGKPDPTVKPVEPTFGADSKTVPPKGDKVEARDPFDPAQFNKQPRPAKQP